MQWSVQLGGKSFIVELPDQLSGGVTFSAKVNGQAFEARWNDATRTLSLGAGASERSLTLRYADRQRFAGESEARVAAEFSGPGGMTNLQASVSPYVPGQEKRARAAAARASVVRSPMTGKVLKVLVANGHRVTTQSPLLVIEAMKMENKITASRDGIVSGLRVQDGQLVTSGDVLLEITGDPA